MSAPDTRPPQEAAVIIELPNRLKEKVGGSLDGSLAAKAEHSVQLMSGDFRQWLEDIVALMGSARTALGHAPLTKAATLTLYTQALEVKSLADTYGYPLVTRFANSLCRLLVKLEDERPAPLALVDAHIDAIRAALKAEMKAVDHPVGAALVRELEQQVGHFHQTT